ncbi:hypothetical protein TNCT6_38050 [Streptomyces sp. 6-11-2]|nr:hypothetical protein TNCT6_38050 [Streptomyces sp. 6-11-2]
MDLLLEAAVHPVQVLLFHTDLSVPYGVVRRFVRCGVDRSDRGILLSLCGHRAPF